MGGILLYTFFSKWIFKEFVENSSLELLWTFFPIFILLNIGLYRIIILYRHEIEKKRFLSIKVTGHQWYWRYDYSDFKRLEYDSYMLPLRECKTGTFRLLEVDNNVVIPFSSVSRFVIRRADVLHAWTIPSLAIKVDANPGRLNLVSFNSLRMGLFFGQCREICGANHRFIPICVEVSSIYFFKNWILNF